MSKILIIQIVFLAAVGCVTLSVSPLNDKVDTGIAKQCDRTPVVIRYLEDNNFGYREHREIPNVTKEPAEGFRYASSYVFEVIKESDLFVESRDNPKFVLSFEVVTQTYSNLFQQTWWWFSFVTLGVIPSYGSGSLQVNVIISDINGNSLQRYDSDKLEFGVGNGLIFLPVAFFHEHTLAYINKKYIPILTEQVVRKIKKAQFFCKNKEDL